MKKLLTTTIMLGLAGVTTFAQAQKTTTTFEAFSNNEASGMVPRSWQYRPEGSDFVCVNGNNRYTRALYGSNTEYRLETSDTPIFALYKAKNYRNVRMKIGSVSLENVEHCEARYGGGRRTYLMRDSRWGKDAMLKMECVLMPTIEQTIWHIQAEGFQDQDIDLEVLLTQIANPRLRRNGDIGADKKGSFEPSPKNEGLETFNLKFSKEAYVMSKPAETREKGHEMYLFNASASEAQPIKQSFVQAKNAFETLASRVKFVTPDPYLNTLGMALTLAADGAWDGETWLHGAIGWRMPLAGWRAGYLGDVLGWNERAISHFDAYQRSQVTDVPATISSPSQDKEMNLARAEKKWGTQMYSNGYICRNPNRNNQMHHYDMNLNYVDELLWHFQYDADTTYMRKMWPLLTSHLAWEKRNFDKDNNHLYDAYCCIWASDALYYNGGEVSHSTAYNYRGNLLAAKIARIIGEDATPYEMEAEAIQKAMQKSLWVSAADEPRYASSVTDKYFGHWAEYRDVMGHGRLHPDAALWSIYTPIDCGVGSAAQMYSCTEYVDRFIPHIPVEVKNESNAGSIISTSDWMPYSWSINNVASAEIMHTALAFFEAGRSDKGYELLKSNILDQMYLGCSPGNLGQISYYDAARGESYRDFGDNIGISSRAIIQGLFGIVPQALDGKCVVRPGFPLEWDSVEVSTPYLSYKYKRQGANATLDIEQHFTRPLNIVVRVNEAGGKYKDVIGNSATHQTISFRIPTDAQPLLAAAAAPDTLWIKDVINSNMIPSASNVRRQHKVDMQKVFNASVTDIFKPQYVSPRPQSTSLEIPIQGIGEWCHPKFTVEINDSVFRSLASKDEITLGGIKFATPQKGDNIVFASLWDNYPAKVSIPITKPRKATHAVLLLAGSTNHMQVHMDNAIITATYTDGTTTSLRLRPPYNYCPIEQDYYVDNKAFRTSNLRPMRVSLSTGKVSRTLGAEMNVPATEVYGRQLVGGAAQLLSIPLDGSKKLQHINLECLSNDIVVGIMGVTLLTK